MGSQTAQGGEVYRQLEPQWNPLLIVASIAISFLGAFTSTQLMCHARMSLRFHSVLLWVLFGSFVFGGCSVWCLHMVAMLACEFDVKMGINTSLTVLSAFLPVFFTFLALGSELLWERWHHGRGRKKRRSRKTRLKTTTLSPMSKYRNNNNHSFSLHPVAEEEEEEAVEDYQDEEIAPDQPLLSGPRPSQARNPESQSWSGPRTDFFRSSQDGPGASFDSSLLPASPGVIILRDDTSTGFRDDASTVSSGSFNPSSTEGSTTRRESSSGSSTSHGLSSAMGLAYRRAPATTMNAFVATAKILYYGMTPRNIIKGFLWSLAITSMHYSGIYGLKVPHGKVVLDPWIVLASALISWLVCTVGCICMAEMEAMLSQQLLFSVVATTGVSSMHWTGMAAATFWSTSPPSELRGYPPEIAAAVVLIAFTTCIAANGLLAHSATVSRNKLAEIIWTRRELWRTIAQKENAEAAALARSEFIAAASHEIRTPLHHLQGYSDLLSQTPLTEEGRAHLAAIQRATKTLSLITNNVLDWSKLEKDAKAVCKPVSLDIRTVCESIIILLPNKDDEADVELCVVVAPDVPASVFVDETYIHRILMNLLSNACKFTRSGYIILSIEVSDDKLIASVRDTGIGLDPNFIPQMFEPYKQGEQKGNQRGTGLGLSIIKQLLQAMNGTITVESKFAYSHDVGPNQSGSTFTVTIPLQPSSLPPQPSEQQDGKLVAVLSDAETRSLQGVKAAWEMFGHEVIVATSMSELPDKDWKYIWADMPFLLNNKDQFRRLMKRQDWLILVPYDTQKSLSDLPGIVAAPNFVLLPRPLVWHSFATRVDAANRRSRSATVSRTLRFDPVVEVMQDEEQQKSGSPVQGQQQTVLLVEDNVINAKLFQKMLVSLKHKVIIAPDGEAAVSQVLTHDTAIDIIFMDQSMPKKDGITATREIRALEQEGKLQRKHLIIALTAVVNTESRAKFKEAGADDFLAKPLSLTGLKDALAVHLGC
ncbi:PAS/PAC sensor hybrid histidine kinase [Aureobasidium melanogenum CBS 110374]|uniref:histidine kinase n=1 Tax=Aureobasidium melanogenum (strain CBS 110374) TaxID=1043003 RepID=A0A074VVM4_AURM1|nr:PAS/PAC sensor hybrid histidine kinase [Aureobasidium melanogenum CBS 110374]KEQ63304.1 PAS/PAC sensor hybrid histidine kinase [Aureobasidium melanogenum CBS 110374]